MTQAPPYYGPPGMPPPPPPPPHDWEAPRKTSGKAIASLVCGIAGVLVCLFGVVNLIGVVLGIIAIAETGKNGTRSGRGLAIAGTIVSCLGLAVAIAWTVFVFHGMSEAEQEETTVRQEQVDHDIRLIVDRLKQYYHENGGSLGPGGPALAMQGAKSEVDEWDSGDEPPAGTRDGKVVGNLSIRHLVRRDELEYSVRSMNRWTISVTDRGKATVRLTTRGGRTLYEASVTNAATGAYVQSYGSTPR